MKFERPMTAAEAMAKLQADPEWIARDSEHKAKVRQRTEKLRQEAAPLLHDLASVGHEVESVFDLVNTEEPYPKAIPVLIDHLSNPDHYHWRTREGIARALTVKEAKSALPDILEAFRRDPDTSLNGPKGALGNAVCLLADERYLQEIIELALDGSHGKRRWALVEWLGNSQTNSVRATLERLKSDPDPDIAIAAKKGLKTLGPQTNSGSRNE